MVKVLEYNHVGIVVRNLEKCRWFYGEILGLETMARPPFNFPGHWYKVGAALQLHLMVFDEPKPNTMSHFALEVDNFDSAVDHLRQNDIDIVEGPAKRPDGSDYLFCLDPDGNRLELTRH